MKMVHEQVHHRPFGVGIITSQSESILEVTFAQEFDAKKFIYPCISSWKRKSKVEVAYIDVERALDPSQPDDAEQALEITDALIHTGLHVRLMNRHLTRLFR